LNLSPDQKAKMQEIGRNTRAQMEAILTPEQKTKLKAAMAERKAQYQARKEQRPDRGTRSRKSLCSRRYRMWDKKKISNI